MSARVTFYSLVSDKSPPISNKKYYKFNFKRKWRNKYLYLFKTVLIYSTVTLLLAHVPDLSQNDVNPVQDFKVRFISATKKKSKGWSVFSNKLPKPSETKFYKQHTLPKKLV